MKRMYVYVDASVIGGCEDSEFAEASLALWWLSDAWMFWCGFG